MELSLNLLWINYYKKAGVACQEMQYGRKLNPPPLHNIDPPLHYYLMSRAYIDSTRRGHVTSRNGEILIVATNRPYFTLALLKPTQKEQGAFN